MSGSVPSLPSSLQYIYIGYPGSPGNHFFGKVVLNQPIIVFLNDNWITDLVIYDPVHLTNCDLSNNPLLGDPHIANLTSKCTSNGLYVYSAGILSSTAIASSRTVLKVTSQVQSSAASLRSTIGNSC